MSGRRNDIIEELKRLENPDEIRENKTCGIDCHKSKSRDVVGAEYNLKGRAVANYLRINELSAALKIRIDDGEFTIAAAVQLSYLAQEEQQMVEAVLSESEYKVNEGKAVLLREYTGKLTPERAEQILSGEFNRKPKKSTAAAFKVKPAIYKKYFTASISQKEFDSIVDEALALYLPVKSHSRLNWKTTTGRRSLLRNDERLRTIYEVMAPYIVRSERNWRDYLAFASRFHKQSFDNILLVYAQDEDVTILATKKQWAGVGRNLISRPKGIAVCVYSNARLTLDYLFDISQTVGKEIHPTNWQLSDEMQKALGERLTFSHGFQTQPFPDLLYALAREAVNDNYEHYLQGLRQETKNHLFEEIPAGGFEAQYIQLLSDSVSYFIGKKCHLPDEAIRMGDGMATVNHFNTVPLVAHLGMAVTSISKAVLLEMGAEHQDHQSRKEGKT